MEERCFRKKPRSLTLSHMQSFEGQKWPLVRYVSIKSCGIELVIYTNICSNPLNTPQCHRVTYIKSLYFCSLRSVELVNFTDVTEITRTIKVGLVS